MLETIEYLNGVINKVLDIHSYFEELRCKNSNRISGEINYILEMEELHCQTFPTHIDYRKLLGDLYDKENIIMYEAERNITIAILLMSKEKYETESTEC